MVRNARIEAAIKEKKPPRKRPRSKQATTSKSAESAAAVEVSKTKARRVVMATPVCVTNDVDLIAHETLDDEHVDQPCKEPVTRINMRVVSSETLLQHRKSLSAHPALKVTIGQLFGEKPTTSYTDLKKVYKIRLQKKKFETKRTSKAKASNAMDTRMTSIFNQNKKTKEKTSKKTLDETLDVLGTAEDCEIDIGMDVHVEMPTEDCTIKFSACRQLIDGDAFDEFMSSL